MKVLNINSVAVALFLVFLITTLLASSRKLPASQGGAHLGIKSKRKIDSFTNLMGIEECGNEEDECLSRRALADAHLDYIYTQHHKP